MFKKAQKKGYEGSPADMKADAKMAKKAKMTPEQWEASPQDAAMDAAEMKRKGGGKMSTGAAKKGFGVKKRATGGKVSSRGAAQRGFGAEKR
jgi:hypothetical protein